MKNMLPTLSLPFGWNMNKLMLVLFNIFAGIVLIALSHNGVLPLDSVNFIFFSCVGFLFALYRPGWAFLFLIGMLPYEIISIAPESFGIAIRPYQWLLVLVALTLLIRLALKRFPLDKLVPNFWDMSVVIFSISTFLSAFMSDHKTIAIKLSIILFSFILLYFVTRIFVRSIDDVRMLLPFLLSSFLVITLYAMWQNLFFMSGRESFEVMAGRPNAPFSEADWLGGYLAMMITALIALIVSPSLVSKYASIKQTRLIASMLLFFGFIALIITVSRSAWLSALSGILIALVLFGWQRGVFDALRWQNRQVLKRAFSVMFFIAIPFFLALLAVFVFGLSPFDLLDRSKSIASGEQKITIACEKEIVLPKKIGSIGELASFGCSHINLEDIAAERTAGRYVAEVLRNDPNVEIRQSIYTKITLLIKEHWLTGIGFGVVSQYLGADERPASPSLGGGAGFNASNIFLEVWLGAGIVGFLAFIFFWFGLGLRWLFMACQGNSPLALVLGSMFISITVFNLFNSGLFLAWFFVFLAFLVMPVSETAHE